MQKIMGFTRTRENAEKKGALIPSDFTHAAIIGETGSGKTTAMIYPNLLDRMQKGYAVFAVDYKGGESAKIKALARRAGRLKDVVSVGARLDAPINLIASMKPRDFKNCVKKPMESREKFWEEFGSSIATEFFKVLKALKIFAKKITPLSDCYTDAFYADVRTLARDFTFDVATILRLSQDLEKMLEFKDALSLICDNLDSSTLNFTRETIMINRAFLATTDEFLDATSRYKDIGDERTRDDFRNYSMMMSPFLGLMNDDSLNGDGEGAAGDASIAGLLNSGKIVIFNAASCDKSALSFLLNSFLPELLKRVTMKQKRPISLFLDESAKLLSENTELNEEILRECEVELVLAFQNEFLLKRAIGGTAYEALMGNLTNRYFMRNKDVVRLGSSEVDCSTLEKFECVLEGDKIALEPIFIDEAECLQAQLEFERKNRLHERLLGKIYENRVIEFDEELVDDGKIWVRDVDTGERECVFFSDEVLDIRPQDIYKRPPNTGGYNISLEDGTDDAQISFK